MAVPSRSSDQVNRSMGEAMTEEGFLEEVDLERWVDLRQVRRPGRGEWANRTDVAGAPWGGGRREAEARREARARLLGSGATRGHYAAWGEFQRLLSTGMTA